MTTKVQFRRGNASDWTSHNPILAEGEMGLELDTGYFKIGNGIDTWTVLNYAAPATLTGLKPGAPVFGSSTGTAIQNEAGTAGQILMSYGDIANGGPHFVDVSIKESIHVATTEHLDATYNNANITEGDYPVIASSLTMNSVGHTTVDGIELELDDRVLIKNQNNPIENGIYVVIQEGEAVGEDPANPLGQSTIFVRDNDSDTSSKISAALAQVQNGVTNGGQMFTTYFAETDTIGTSPIVYNNVVQTPGTGNAGEFLMSYGGYGVHAPQFVQLNVHEPVTAASTATIPGTYIVGTTINITAISSNTTTWTFTYSGAPFSTYKPAVGAEITIAGCTPLAYNGTYTVSSSTTNQFSITQGGNPGNGTVFGTATQGDLDIDPAATADKFYVTTSGVLTIDGIDIAADDRVLFKDQTNSEQNGVWLCLVAGAPGVSAKFTRDNDFDVITKFPASIVQVTSGDLNGGQSFTTYAKGTDVLGQDPIIWNTVVQSPGAGTAGEFLMSYGGYGTNAPQWVQLNVKEPADLASTINYSVDVYVPGVELDVTSVTSNATTWTYTFTGGPWTGYIPVVGQDVHIEHISPSIYNGDFTVASATTTTFTVTHTGNPGPSTNGGTAEQGLLDLDPTEPSDYMILTNGFYNVGGFYGIDGVVGEVDQRILLKDQTDDYQNGVWLVYDMGVGTDYAGNPTSGKVVLSRDNDSNTIGKVAASLVQVVNGTINGGQVFTTYTSINNYLGKDPIKYNTVVQAPGAGTAGQFLMSYGGYGDFAPQFIQLNIHEPMDLATTANIPGTYAVASYAGIDPSFSVDKFTATTAGQLTVDGTQLSLDTRILFKDQTTATQNGIWLVIDDGVTAPTSGYTVFVRDNDADAIYKLSASLVQVIGGTQNSSTTWQAVIPAGATLGTSPINFVKLSSNISTSIIANNVNNSAITLGTETAATQLTIPPNYLVAGSTYRIRALGSRTGTTSAGLTFNTRIGTTTTANAGNLINANAIAASAVASSFEYEGTFTVRTAGATGTIIGSSRTIYGTTLLLSTGTGTVAVDTTVTNYLKLSHLSTTSNADVWTIYVAEIEQVV